MKVGFTKGIPGAHFAGNDDAQKLGVQVPLNAAYVIEVPVAAGA